MFYFENWRNWILFRGRHHEILITIWWWLYVLYRVHHPLLLCLTLILYNFTTCLWIQKREVIVTQIVGKVGEVIEIINKYSLLSGTMSLGLESFLSLIMLLCLVYGFLFMVTRSGYKWSTSVWPTFIIVVDSYITHD